MGLASLYKFKKAVMLCSFLVSGMVCIPCASAQDLMTIEESYETLGKERIPFDKSQSSLPPEELKYLDHLFFVTDLAFRERMEMLRHFHFKKSEKYINTYLDNIDEFISSFDKKSAPTKDLRSVEINVINALKDQKNFFIKWHNSKGTYAYTETKHNLVSDSYVQKSHRKLLDAYIMLKSLYPYETEHNQQAIYQHLCALDFI